MMNNEKYPIEKLVKHRRGMLLVNRLVSYDENSVVVEAKITPHSTFLENGGVPAWVGVEYAAQAVAALSGLRALKSDEEPKIGFLLSCRRYKCTRAYFAVGETLVIHVDEEFNDGRMGAYRCTILDGAEEEIATISISAYVPDNIQDIEAMTA